MIPLARAALLVMAGPLCLLDARAEPRGQVPDYCVAAEGGGAAPPVLLSTEQLAAVKAILSKYHSDALSEDDARAIRQALHDAGLRSGPALDKALADAGFSAKRLATLAPCAAAPQDEANPITSDRIVPPPQ
jgi:hypothetical protein